MTRPSKFPNTILMIVILLLVLSSILFAQGRTSQEPAIKLDSEELFIPCPPGYATCRRKASDDLIVKVVAHSVRKNIPYSYEVTGGRIIGKGRKVQWDLTGVSPGTYHIFLRGSNLNNIRTATAVITVQSADCICDPVCPLVTVTSSKPKASPGEIVFFDANILYGTDGTIEYVWRAPLGKILGGRKTSRVKIQIPPDFKVGKDFRVTLDIGGLDPAWACPTSVEKSLRIENSTSYDR